MADAGLDVWVVTLNGDVRAICRSREAAGAAIDAIKGSIDRSPRHPGAWRQGTEDSWSADQVTSLRRCRWRVQ